jgi:hypothetical protein
MRFDIRIQKVDLATAVGVYIDRRLSALKHLSSPKEACFKGSFGTKDQRARPSILASSLSFTMRPRLIFCGTSYRTSKKRVCQAPAKMLRL